MQPNRCNRDCCWFQVFMIVLVSGWLMAGANVAIADYSSTAHGDGTDGVNRTGTAFSIGDCAHCHDTFDSDICTGVTGGPSMLFAELDNPDFCMECHTDTGSVQDGGMSGAPASIADVFAQTYKHNVAGYSDLHRFWPVSPPANPADGVENRTYISANKHVECNDCHNPHMAEAGLHDEVTTEAGLHLAAGTNNISDSGPLTGAFGVSPTAWKSWSVWSMSWSTTGAQSWPSTSSTATKEYQICFKCHAGYNTNATSWGGSGAAAWTQVDMEFNPRLQSYHPVVQALPEVDPGYYYYDYSDTWYGVDEWDTWGSNRIPPSHISVVIGDSGLATGTSGGIQDSTKSWETNEWVGWGLRVGARSWITNSNYHPIRRITSNTATSLGFSPGTTLSATNTVYSIEYYAGYADNGGKSGLTVTDTTKNFNLYLPSLQGYTVMISDAGVNNVAKGVIQSNTATSFTVGSWQAMYGTVPGDTTVCYFISGTGQSMMCSDCHSTDTISSTTAQGPHGSSVKWMLRGRNKAWPTLSAADNGTGTGSTLRRIGDIATDGTAIEHRAVNDGTDNGLFCLNCHSVVSFTKDLYGRENAANIHAPHAQADSGPPLPGGVHKGPACVECHVLVPHGSAMSRLMGNVCPGSSSAMPARYNFDSQNKMEAFGAKIFAADHSGKTGDPATYPGDAGGSPGYCSGPGGDGTHNCHPNLRGPGYNDCGWFTWTW